MRSGRAEGAATDAETTFVRVYGARNALLGAVGPYAPLLEIARGFEAADPRALGRIKTELNVDPADAHRALLHALATADSLQSLIR